MSRPAPALLAIALAAALLLVGTVAPPSHAHPHANLAEIPSGVVPAVFGTSSCFATATSCNTGTLTVSSGDFVVAVETGAATVSASSLSVKDNIDSVTLTAFGTTCTGATGSFLNATVFYEKSPTAGSGTFTASTTSSYFAVTVVILPNTYYPSGMAFGGSGDGTNCQTGTGSPMFAKVTPASSTDYLFYAISWLETATASAGFPSNETADQNGAHNSGNTASSAQAYRTAPSTVAQRMNNTVGSGGPTKWLAAVLDVPAVQVPAAATSLHTTNVTGSTFAVAWTAPTVPAGVAIVNVTLEFGNASGVYDATHHISMGNVTSWTQANNSIADLQAGFNYYMIVICWTTAGAGPATSVLTLTTLPNKAVGFGETSATTTSITFGWSQPRVGNSATIANDTLDWGTSSPTTRVSLGAVTSYTLTGLSVGTTYQAELNVWDAGGSSGYTSVKTVATLSGPPTGPVATTVSTSSITVSWTAPSPSGAVTNYTVEQGTVSGGPYPTHYSAGTGTSYTVTGLSHGTRYYFVVLAWTAGGSSSASAQVTNVTDPDSPTALTAVTISTSSITVSWTAPSPSGAVTNYTVEQGTASGGPYTTHYSVGTGTSYTVAGLAHGTRYYFVVLAWTAGGSSSASAEVTNVTDPDSPTALTAVTISTSSITVSWTAPSPSANVVNYTLERGTASGGPYATHYSVGTGTSYSVTGLAHGTRYYFVVLAWTVGGSSSASAQVTNVTDPDAATGLRASTVDDQSIALTWSLPTPTANDVNVTIEVGKVAGTYTRFLSAGGGSSYTVTGLGGARTYYFVAVVWTQGGAGAASSYATNTTDPNATTNVTAQAVSSATIVVTFVLPAGTITNVTIEQGTTVGVYPAHYSIGNVSSYNVIGLAANATYHFVLIAWDGVHPSAPSADVFATTEAASGGGGGSSLSFRLVPGSPTVPSVGTYVVPEFVLFEPSGVAASSNQTRQIWSHLRLALVGQGTSVTFGTWSIASWATALFNLSLELTSAQSTTILAGDALLALNSTAFVSSQNVPASGVVNASTLALASSPAAWWFVYFGITTGPPYTSPATLGQIFSDLAWWGDSTVGRAIYAIAGLLIAIGWIYETHRRARKRMNPGAG